MRYIYVGSGINVYKYMPESALTKCVSDVKGICAMLQKYGFETYTLYDTQCTRNAIVEKWDAAIASVKPNEEALIVFHQSSHGTQQTEIVRGSEADGMDEVLVCYDTKWNDGLERWDNGIVDDDVKALLDRVPPNITIEIMFDACHSGNMCRGAKPKMFKSARKFIYPRNWKTGKITKVLGKSTEFTRHILLAGTSPDKYSYEDVSGGLLSTSMKDVISGYYPNMPTRSEAIKYVTKCIKQKNYDQPAHYEMLDKYNEMATFSLGSDRLGPKSRGILSWFKKLFLFFL